MYESAVAEMGRKLNLSHLSEEETERILQVLQKDFELRNKEKERIGEIEKVVKEEEDIEKVVAKKTNLNENVCVRCCQGFGLIFNRRQICLQCKLFVCKGCCQYDLEKKGYMCKACIQERELKLKSCEWFYNNVSKKFKRFGSAKVVRTLYKQKSNRTRQYHTDNESDSGYDPSLYSSLKSSSTLTHPALHGMIQTDEEIDSIGPAPIVTSTISRTSSVETLTNDNNRNNNKNDHLEDDNKERDKQDIYKEAFEHYKQTEERKFHTKFDDLLKQLYTSLEQPAQTGSNNFGSTSYGQVMEKYRSQLRELLVGLSQRLEMAVESFDNSSQSFTDTSQKVRKIVSKLVEDSFGESIDVTSDEAVSDLSSLSDDSGDHQVKSFEDQIAQAVVARVLENFRREANIEIPLDFLDGNFSDVLNKSHDSHVMECDRSHDLQSKGTSSDDDTSVISKCSYGCQVNEEKPQVQDCGIQSETDQSHPLNKTEISEKAQLHDFGVQSNFSEPDTSAQRTPNLCDFGVQSEPNEVQKIERPVTTDTSVQSELSDLSYSKYHKPHTEDFGVQSEFIESDVISPERNNNLKTSINTKETSSARKDSCVQNEVSEPVISENSDADLHTPSSYNEENEAIEPEDENKVRERDLAELKQFSQKFKSQRPLQQHDFEELLDEQPIQKVTVNREEYQEDFASRVSTYDRLHDSHTPLPDFSDDYDDNDFFQNEVDPDLLSMNLAPILEEEEEDYEDDEDGEKGNNSSYGGHWRDNWIFNSSKLSPYSNVGKKLGGGNFDQVYLTIPQPEEELAPRVGSRKRRQRLRSRDTDQMSDTISEIDEDRDADDLSDEESSFFTRNMDEITRITSRKSSAASSSAPHVSSGIQTDESELETSMDTSVSMRSMTSKKSEPALIEEIISAEGDDPKFELPAESVSVLEGEVVKFSCRVRGTEPIDVMWYRIVEGELMQLEDSEFYEVSHDQNKHTLTIFNPSSAIAGQYMSMAVNDKGHCSQYIILTVKNNPQEFKKPEFLKEIQDVEVKEGQNVKFRSKVKGCPQPRVVWYKDGKFLKNGGNYQIEKFGNRDYILTIHSATPEDDAEYCVVARNIGGDVKSTAQLIVESKELDSSPKTPEVRKTTPTKNKDSQQLSNMGRKLFMTREKMQSETEDMIHSANKQNAAENLRNTTSSALAILRSTENLLKSENMDDETDDCFVATSTPRIEDSPRKLAFQDESNNNNVMSDVNISSRNIVNIVPKLDLKSDIHIAESSTDYDVTSYKAPSQFPEHISEDVVSQSHVEQSHSPVFHPHQDLNPPQAEVPSNNSSELLSNFDEQPSVVNFGAKEVDMSKYPDYYVGDQPTSPRRKWEVQTDSYSPRAEVVNRSQLQHTETEIYIAASGIYGLEGRIRNLQSALKSTPITNKVKLEELEDAVACTVAQVEVAELRVQQVEKAVANFQQPPSITMTTCNNDDMSSLSPSLSIDSGFSSIKDRPQPTVLCGETLEDDLPESRTEFNEEVADKLPSVNRLKALFGHLKEEDSSLKRSSFNSTDEGMVHSITGRNVSKEKLEKLRQLGDTSSQTTSKSTPSVKLTSTEPQLRHVEVEKPCVENTTGISTMSVKLAHSEPRVRQVEAEPTQIFPKNKGELYPASLTPSKSSQNKVEQKPLHVSTSSKSRAPAAPSSQNKSNSVGATSNNAPAQSSYSKTSPPSGKGRAPQPPKSSTPVTTGSKMVTPTATPTATPTSSSTGKGKSRIRSGCINARASFWEKRIQGEETKEEEFPDMIEHVDE